MKKILIYILALAFIFSSLLTPMPDVHAADTGYVIEQYFNALFERYQLDNGFILSPEEREKALNFSMLESMEDYRTAALEQLQSAIDAGIASYNMATGNIKIGESTYAQLEYYLEKILDEYFAQEKPSVLWIPVIPADEFPSSHFYSTTQYYQFRSYADDKDLTYVCASPNASYFKMHDVSNNYIYCGYEWSQCAYDTYVENAADTFTDTTTQQSVGGYLATCTGIKTDHREINGVVYDDSGLLPYEGNEPIYALSYNWHNDMQIFLYPYYISNLNPSSRWSGGQYDSNGFLVCSADEEAHYIPYFSTIDAVKEYVTGQAEIYQLTPTYQGGDITVNPNIDYGKLYDAVSAAMSNSAANGENVTQQLSAMQDAYEATMQEISGTLGDIEDNTEQSNSWLEKIYNNTASIASILIEQFDAMTETISNGFASVVDGLSDVSLGLGEIGDGSGGDSDSGGGSKLSFWDKLGNFFGTTLGGVFDLISIIIMKALDGVGWLADKLIDNLGKALDGVSEIMDRYTKKITENNTLSKLGEAIPPELKDLFTFFFFGVIGAGIIRAAKK